MVNNVRNYYEIKIHNKGEEYKFRLHAMQFYYENYVEFYKNSNTIDIMLKDNSSIIFTNLKGKASLISLVEGKNNHEYVFNEVTKLIRKDLCYFYNINDRWMVSDNVALFNFNLIDFQKTGVYKGWKLITPLSFNSKSKIFDKIKNKKFNGVLKCGGEILYNGNGDDVITIINGIDKIKDSIHHDKNYEITINWVIDGKSNRISYESNMTLEMDLNSINIKPRVLINKMLFENIVDMILDYKTFRFLS